MPFFPHAKQENNDSGSPRRRGSPRHTGRGSPGARISWLTAARSGVGGQVMLNDKGKGGVGRGYYNLFVFSPDWFWTMQQRSHWVVVGRREIGSYPPHPLSARSHKGIDGKFSLTLH